MNTFQKGSLLSNFNPREVGKILDVPFRALLLTCLFWRQQTISEVVSRVNHRCVSKGKVGIQQFKLEKRENNYCKKKKSGYHTWKTPLPIVPPAP